MIFPHRIKYYYVFVLQSIFLTLYNAAFEYFVFFRLPFLDVLQGEAKLIFFTLFTLFMEGERILMLEMEPSRGSFLYYVSELLIILSDLTVLIVFIVSVLITLS